MKNITESLGMGEYGIYVWPSFIIAAVIILVMLVITLRSLRRAQKILSNLTDNKD